MDQDQQQDQLNGAQPPADQLQVLDGQQPVAAGAAGPAAQPMDQAAMAARLLQLETRLEFMGNKAGDLQQQLIDNAQLMDSMLEVPVTLGNNLFILENFNQTRAIYTALIPAKQSLGRLEQNLQETRIATAAVEKALAYTHLRLTAIHAAAQSTSFLKSEVADAYFKRLRPKIDSPAGKWATGEKSVREIQFDILQEVETAVERAARMGSTNNNGGRNGRPGQRPNLGPGNHNNTNNNNQGNRNNNTNNNTNTNNNNNNNGGYGGRGYKRQYGQ